MSYTDKMQDAAQNFAKSVNPDFVRALGGDGSGLPDYSEASVGDVLTLASTESDPSGVEPKWSAPSAGGGGIMYVTISVGDVEGEPVYSADKTLDEIIAAVGAGQDVRATLADGGGYLYLTGCADSDGQKFADFSVVTISPSDNSPTNVFLGTNTVYISNEGSGDVVELWGTSGEFALTNS